MSREIKTALLVLVAIVLFIWGFSFLKGSDILSSDTKLYVKYTNVEGLGIGAPVTVSGHPIGKVSKITLDNQDASLLVELTISNSEFPIQKTAKANIYEPSLIGNKQIQIVPDFKSSDLISDGDYLQGEVVAGIAAALTGKLDPLTSKIDSIMVQADLTLRSLNNVLDSKTQAHLKQTFASLESTVKSFDVLAKDASQLVGQNKGKLNASIANVEKITADFAKVTEALAQADIDGAVKNLQSTMENVNAVLAGIEQGQGSLGKLAKDEALYTNLTNTSKEMELLLEDLRLNPTRYINISIFGKKNKPYVAPAEQTP